MRKLHTYFAILAAVAAVAIASPTQAQKYPQTRQGFWGNLGVGYGSFGCQDCDGRTAGGTAMLALGGTLNEKWLIGGGTTAWTKEEDGVTLTVSTLTALARFYPKPAGGLYILGGLGIGRIAADVDGYGSESESGTGVVIGLGYDYRIGANLSITPFWNGVAVSAGDSDGNYGQLGVGITLH